MDYCSAVTSSAIFAGPTCEVSLLTYVKDELWRAVRGDTWLVTQWYCVVRTETWLVVHVYVCAGMEECAFDFSWLASTHPFNGPFSGTTQLGRYQKGKTNLNFTEAVASAGTYASLHLTPDR